MEVKSSNNQLSQPARCSGKPGFVDGSQSGSGRRIHSGYAEIINLINGAPISGFAVDKVEQVIGYVGLGYPFGLLSSILFGRHYKAIRQSPKPKLFVRGTRDGFTSVKQLKTKLKSAQGRVETHLVEGTDHFELEGPYYDAYTIDLIVKFIESL